MLRLALPVLLAVACLIALLPKATRRRWLYTVAGLVLLYTLLKLTGVFEAIAPSRNGVY